MESCINARSEKIGEILKGICFIQMHIKKLEKSTFNQFYKSYYTPLEDILNALKELQEATGLIFTQIPTGTATQIELTTRIDHINGTEFIEYKPTVFPISEKFSVQQAGAVYTYLRRYALTAILNLNTEIDDDANSASGVNSNKPPTKPPNKPQGNYNPYNTPNPNVMTNTTPKIGQTLNPNAQNSKGEALITQAQVQRMYTIGKGKNEQAKAILKKYGYESGKSVKVKDYDKICKEIQNAPEQATIDDFENFPTAEEAFK